MTLRKKILSLLTLTLGLSTGMQAFDWTDAADELLSKLDQAIPQFNADIALYNDLAINVGNVRTLLANNAAGVTSAFATLTAQYQTLSADYAQVESDVTAAAAAAQQAKNALQEQLASIIASTDTQIATLNQDIATLTAQRDELASAYNSMVGNSSTRADQLLAGARNVTDAYNGMIAAKTALLEQVAGLQADATALLASVSGTATDAVQATTPAAPTA